MADEPNAPATDAAPAAPDKRTGPRDPAVLFLLRVTAAQERGAEAIERVASALERIAAVTEVAFGGTGAELLPADTPEGATPEGGGEPGADVADEEVDVQEILRRLEGGEEL